MNRRGFTLLEMVVVVSIIALMASMVAVRVETRPNPATVTKSVNDEVTHGLERYKLTNGRYPTTEQGLQALVERPTAQPVPAHWKPYLKTLPVDGWDRALTYTSQTAQGAYVLRSAGADGESDTADDMVATGHATIR